MSFDLSAIVIDVAKAALGALIAGWIGYEIWLKQYFRGIRQAYDLELRTQRLGAYQELLSSFRSFALFAPPQSVSYAAVGQLAFELSNWYFSRGGLIMSTRTRNVYFLVQEALEQFPAVLPEGTDRMLRVASRDASASPRRLRMDLIDDRRRDLDLIALSERTLRSSAAFTRWKTGVQKRTADWKFGNPGDDFVLAQFLGSTLRTAFIADLHSRDAGLLEEMEKS